MRWMRQQRLRFQSLFHRSCLEEELEDELRDYIERETDRATATGWSPEEARTAAMRSLEGIQRLKEECRDARKTRWIEDGLRDLRFALRMMRRTPIFTFTVIAT